MGYGGRTMISRGAENCFWLCRNIERIESFTRFLSVNHIFVLDYKLSLQEAWFPFVVVAGEEERFIQYFGEAAIKDGELIQNYLTWDKRNPVSIFNSFQAARENAQTIRETISLEMWESLNTFWLWLNSRKSKHLYQKDRLEFCATIKQACHIFHGLFYTSFIQQEAYYFMKLGMMLERANQTARILDVKYHRISLTEQQNKESVLETAHWLALLQLCSANEEFLKRSFYVRSKKVAEFLLLERTYPRAILFCLVQALDSLEQLRSFAPPQIGCNAYNTLKRLIEVLRNKSIEEICNVGLHEELTRIVNQTASICNTIRDDYFSMPAIVNQKKSNGNKI
jgi:uncharacterized alpha-E superfamily protein